MKRHSIPGPGGPASGDAKKNPMRSPGARAGAPAKRHPAPLHPEPIRIPPEWMPSDRLARRHRIARTTGKAALLVAAFALLSLPFVLNHLETGSFYHQREAPVVLPELAPSAPVVAPTDARVPEILEPAASQAPLADTVPSTGIQSPTTPAIDPPGVAPASADTPVVEPEQ